MDDRIKSRTEQVVQARIGEPVPAAIERLYVAEGLSQEEVAERLGVHRITVVNWMRDFGIPTRDRRSLAPERVA